MSEVDRSLLAALHRHDSVQSDRSMDVRVVEVRSMVKSMKGARAIAFAFALLLVPGSAVPVHSLTTPAPSLVAPDSADVASMEAIVKALYDVISGPAGQKRDWNRMRSLFIPGARLIPTGPRPTGDSGLRVMDVEGYIAGAANYLETKGFFEREIARRTERFGHIAHVFSTYESRHTGGDPAPFSRGINSIQLLDDGKRWWIVTVFWDAEREGNSLPIEYLNTGKPK